MKTLKALSIAVIVWALAVTLPAYSQDETRPTQGQEEKAKDKDKDKDKQKDKDKNNADRHEDKAKQDEQPGMKQGEERQEQKEQRQDQRQDQKMDRNEHQHPMQGGGKKIPDDKFRSSFGRQHTFHVQRTQVINVAQPVVVYGGYNFQLVDAWPVGWGFDDDCYIDYIDGEYFLFNALHPGVRVAVFVVE